MSLSKKQYANAENRLGRLLAPLQDKRRALSKLALDPSLGTSEGNLNLSAVIVMAAEGLREMALEIKQADAMAKLCPFLSEEDES